MDDNVALLAGNSVVDGMKFLFHRWESDRIQQVYERVFDIVQSELGLATSEVLRLVKFKAVRHQTSDKGSLYSLTVYHEAAQLYEQFPFEWALHLQEMHFKTYLVQVSPGSYEWIADAVHQAEYAINVSLFKSRIREKNKKGTGEKGVRIASRKSDKHSIIYRRAGERPGFETRTSDELVRRTVRSVRADRDAVRASVKMDDAACWQLLHNKLARAGYAAAMKALRSMGIRLTDYIEGCTTERDPEQLAQIDMLDRQLEAYMVPMPKED